MQVSWLHVIALVILIQLYTSITVTGANWQHKHLLLMISIWWRTFTSNVELYLSVICGKHNDICENENTFHKTRHFREHNRISQHTMTFQEIQCFRKQQDSRKHNSVIMLCFVKCWILWNVVFNEMWWKCCGIFWDVVVSWLFWSLLIAMFYFSKWSKQFLDHCPCTKLFVVSHHCPSGCSSRTYFMSWSCRTRYPV